MNWTRSADLKEQVQKLWDRGDLLSSTSYSTDFFPKKLNLKTPSSTELAQSFEEVREWVKEIQALSHYRVEMKQINHRVLSHNVIPHQVWLDNLDAAVAVIGKQIELARFKEMINVTTRRQDGLSAWLLRRPLYAVKLADRWLQLLDMVDWVLLRPKPNIYLRQVDIDGIHSKFIEDHKGVLSELLDTLLPPDCVNDNAIGVSQFERRYGFKQKPVFIRLRSLDQTISLIPGLTRSDISLDAVSFANLKLPVRNVFITENEVNFLSLPELPGTIAIFGKGYGWEALGAASWLRDCRIYYWGDIDTHGFAILDQLRGYLPNAQSILMDRDTLLRFKRLWGEEPQPAHRNMTRLNTSELSLYEELCAGSLGKNIRLEQELIGFDWAISTLKNLP